MISRAGLLFRAADNRQPNSLASQFRRRRFAHFASMLQEFPEPVRILDIGGTPDFWRLHRTQLHREAEITVVNLQPATSVPGIHCVRANARDLRQFEDQTFDIGFSNSLLEHLGDFEQQQRVAAEIKRVCRNYFVQTPNLHFPIEPHFLVPGWQYFPVTLRSYLLSKRRWGWMPRATNLAEARSIVKSIRLLNAREMRKLFPDARILREKVGPLTKSFIARGGVCV